MKRGHQFDSMIAMPVSSQFCDRCFGLQKRLHGKLTQGDNNLRSNEINLLLEERLAGRDLIRLRIAIFRRPELHHITDITDRRLESHSFRKDIVEQLTRSSHKRPPLQIFITTWSFINEAQSGRGITDPDVQMSTSRP